MAAQQQPKRPMTPDEFMAQRQQAQAAPDPAAPAIGRKAVPGLDSPDAKPTPFDTATGSTPTVPKPSVFMNPRTGKQYDRSGFGEGNVVENVLDTPVTGARKMVGGVEHMAQPGMRAKAGGAAQILEGGMEAATPLAVAAGATNPIATARALGVGAAAQWGVSGGAKLVGVPDEYADLAGDVAGIEAGRRVGNAGLRKPRPTNPVQQFHNILKPTAAEFGAQKTFEIAVPEMKAVDAQHRILADPKTVRPGGTTQSSIDLADRTERALWQQYEAKAEPWRRMGATIDANAIADGMQASRPHDILPDESARMDAEIAEFRRRGQIPITEAEEILNKTNADLDRFEAKGPEGQRVASQANTSDVNALKAKARALRDGIYRKIGDYDEGAAPREIKRRWGAVREMRGMLERQFNPATREYTNPLQQAFDLYRGGKEGLLQAGVRAMSPPDTIDAGIWKAFQNYKGAPAPIEKASPIGNTGPRVRGLLPGATEPQTRAGTPYPNPNQTFNMPPPPDTSGAIPATPPRGVRIRPDWQAEGKIPPERQLAAPPPIGPNDPWQRGNPPRQRVPNSVVVNQPVTPQAPAMNMDQVVQFAHENKIPLEGAMKELAQRGYRVNPMPAPTAPQVMPPPQ